MNITVLIIDDDLIVRLVIQKMIRSYDSSVNCHQCVNGEAGLSVLEEIQHTADHIVVLLDINMPVLNGWQFLDRLQQINIVSSEKIQLYMITSSTDESDKKKARSYPVIKRFYYKPLSKEDIQEILVSYANP